MTSFTAGVLIFCRICVLVYGLLLAAGGVFAWFRAKSQVSLWLGLAAGLYFLIIFVVVWIFTTIGFVLATAGAVVLLVAMGLRYYYTSKFMPAGLLCVITLLAMAIFIIGVFFGVFF